MWLVQAPWQVPPEQVYPHPGRYTPWAGTSPWGKYTPPSRYTPQAGTPPSPTGTVADGTHPTGMLSCCLKTHKLQRRPLRQLSTSHQ